MSQVDLQGGFTKWDIAFFYRFWVAGIEFQVERPARLRWRRSTRSQSLLTLAGTTIHQGVYLGGDAPVNLAPMEFRAEFSIFDKDEAFRLGELLSQGGVMPQEFMPGIWISDTWHIPTRIPLQTAWKTSRQLPYGLVDLVGNGDYTPECLIDGEPQTLVTEGVPGEGEFKVEPGVEDDKITLPSAISGTFLTLRYPPLFLVGVVGIDDSIDDNNAWSLSMSAGEHLPNRRYNLTP